MVRKMSLAGIVAASCLAAAAIPSIANAQQPAKAPGKVIVLKAARMFDGKSNSLT
ncbi:MAG: hypothetical protein JO260_02165, partial [Acidobacteria bacterium]|nr:hypothetical protein [Acidobacteriota bacterium]